MQPSKRTALMDAIREVVEELAASGRRFLNRDVVDAVLEEYPDLLAEVGQQLAREKVSDLARRAMKLASSVADDDAQLDLTFGNGDIEVPGMIAVPRNLDDPLADDCEWLSIRHATLADLDANIALLDAGIKADQKRRLDMARLRQRVASVIGENSTLTVAQAAAMAREAQPV